MKTINGKAIRSPQGKAGEYARYSCNFYVGCSCGCTYCYNKTGRFKDVMGGDKPTLKKCFKDEEHALQVFEKELNANLPELQEHGLFFSFTTDPILPETVRLTGRAMAICAFNKVHVKILTKRVEYIGDFTKMKHEDIISAKNYVAIGFSLTGHDELEPNASTNAERIEAMCKLHAAGFKTFASIEPIIDFESSKRVIEKSAGYCNLYKVGLESGKKYNKAECRKFIDWCLKASAYPTQPKFYFKEGLLKAAGIRREDLPANCVTRDYNIFNNK
jgi:DNA repair photolyase